MQKEARLAGAGVLRIGRSLFLLCEDIRRFRAAAVKVHESMVIGLARNPVDPALFHDD